MVEYPACSKRIVAFAALASLAFAGLAQAQTMGANTAGANGGYSRALDQAPNTADAVRDANGQPVAADGVTQAGEDQSGFAHDGADGTLDVASGVGASGAGTAFGDDLNVVTRGPTAAGAKPTSTTTNSAGVNQAQGGGANQ